MPRVNRPTPEGLRPYLFHGLDLSWSDGDSEATGECPWCGREGKFGVKIETGQWHCFVCHEGNEKGGGNAITFIRKLWDESYKATSDYSDLTADRGMLEPDTLMRWGFCRSMIRNEWMVPGYSADGSMCQLYLRSWDAVNDRWFFRPTPTLGHGIHTVGSTDGGTVYVCEGPWDAPALWEIARQCKETDAGYSSTANEAGSLLGDAFVVAVPSCGAVGEPFTKWLPMFAGRRVVLMFDSDHPPKLRDGRTAKPAGLAASQRATKLLSESKDPPSEIVWLRWGKDGYDPALKPGYDVRDCLCESSSLRGRIDKLGQLLRRLDRVPEEWLSARSRDPVKKGKGLASTECRSYRQMMAAWAGALKWRQDIEDTLAVMLAVSISTAQVGDQLFLQVIADAGAAKTRLCDALLVSKHCFALEHLTGFHSGWKDESGEDFSLLSRINYKTLVTPEGDVLMSSPNFVEIMSQQRRIFDGTSGASYKNRKDDLRYTGLRTPWIIAGTPALMDTDQSRLGDRFLRVCIERPSDDERAEILRMVGGTALKNVLVTSNGDGRSHVDDRLCRAYQLTGGYVDYLRSNAADLLASIVVDEDEALSRCAALAEFTADMRARPDRDPHKEGGATKEQPTRLMHQYVRLACCLAAVLQRGRVDDEVLRIVRKVALDTCRGKTLAMARHIRRVDPRVGADPSGLANLTAQTPERTKTLLRFMSSIDVARSYKVTLKNRMMPVYRWKLTDRFQRLYDEVFGPREESTTTPSPRLVAANGNPAR